MRQLLTLSAVGLVGLAGLAVTTTVVQAADSTRDAVLTVEPRAFTAEYLNRDSDGDGWTDWYERLEGTDPNDAASHPNAVRVDVVDGTAFVQSIAFPDRLVAIDLAPLLADVDAGSAQQIIDTIASLGRTSLTKFTSKLVDQVDAIDTGVSLTDMLADATRLTGRSDTPWGLSYWSMISAGNGTSYSGMKDNDSIKVTIDDAGVHTTVTSKQLDDNGSGQVNVSEYTNGTLTGTTKVDYKNGSVTYFVKRDANGKIVEEGAVPLSDVPGGTPAPTQPPATQPVSTAAPQPTEPPKPDEGGYEDPDAMPWYAPTDREVAERVAFLNGVNANYRKLIDLPDEFEPKQSTVSDPAEPDCRDDRCAAFTVIVEPDLSRTSGGCPDRYCNGGNGPGRP